MVDRTGAVQGIMTVERVIQMMREGEHGETFGIQGDEAEVEAAPVGAAATVAVTPDPPSDDAGAAPAG